jgi:hypothetical protein
MTPPSPVGGDGGTWPSPDRPQQLGLHCSIIADRRGRAGGGVKEPLGLP